MNIFIIVVFCNIYFSIFNSISVSLLLCWRVSSCFESIEEIYVLESVSEESSLTKKIIIIIF